MNAEHLHPMHVAACSGSVTNNQVLQNQAATDPVKKAAVIQRFAVLDMTSDERVTFHATEWINRSGERSVDVCSQESAADRHANSVVQRGALAVARYAVIAHFNTDLSDAQDFAYENPRLIAA